MTIQQIDKSISLPRTYLGYVGDAKPGVAAYGSSLILLDATTQRVSQRWIYGPEGWSRERVETVTPITGTASASGDNLLLAAPGSGKCLVIYYWKVQLEADAETTMILKDGANDCYRHFATAKEGGETKTCEPGREWRLAENSALNLHLSAANQVGYNIEYSIEEV